MRFLSPESSEWTLPLANARRPPARACVHVHGGLPGRQVNEQVQRCERLYLIAVDIIAMFAEYIQAAMDQATYEIIDDPEPFYGEVPELEGVWATGKTLEDCRRELQEVIEGWIALKLRFGHPIPAIGGHSINASAEPVSIVE